MGFTSPETPRRHTSGFLEGVSAVMGVLARGASRLKGKPKAATALARPKKLLSNVGNKTLPFGHDQNQKKKEKPQEAEDWGDGGVWQKAILMGDKCQPLDFSGVIYYDSNGKQMKEPPLKSPRASPLPAYLTERLQEHRP